MTGQENIHSSEAEIGSTNHTGEQQEILENQHITQEALTTLQDNIPNPGNGEGNDPEQEQTSDSDQEYYEFSNLPKENTEFIKNLEQLEVKKDAPIYWKEVRKSIKKFDEIDNITDQNIQNYLEIDSTVPKENYPYIAENFKEIMRKYWTYHPKWMSQISNGPATGKNITIEMADRTNKYMKDNLNIIENLLTQSESEQRKYVIEHLDNLALVDFWLKTRLSSLKGEEEGKEKQGETNKKEQNPSERSLFIQRFLQEIPFDKLDTYFETAKNSVLLTALGNNLIREQAKKEELILAASGLLDLFDENKKAKCNKLAEISRKINPKQEKEKTSEKEENEEENKKTKTFDEILDISKDLIENGQNILQDSQTGVQYLDRQLLSSAEGWKALIEFINLSKEISLQIQSIEARKQYEMTNNTQVVMSPTGQYTTGGIGILNAGKLDIEKQDLMSNYEKSYAKVLLYSGKRPTIDITGRTGITLDFKKWDKNKDINKMTESEINEAIEDIVRDTMGKKIITGREKFVTDWKEHPEDRVAQITGATIGVITTGTVVVVGKTINPRVLSGAYTIGDRTGQGLVYEITNIPDSSRTLGEGMGRGWRILDENYKFVGWDNFFIDLGGDYLSGVASFVLSSAIFGSELNSFLKNTTREIIQEFAIDQIILDNPTEILKSGAKAYFDITGNENISGVLNTMISTADKLYSIENLTSSFLHTVTVCGALGTMHKPLNYINGQLTNKILPSERNSCQETLNKDLQDLSTFMKENHLQEKKNKWIDKRTGRIINENSETFQQLQTKLKKVVQSANQMISFQQQFDAAAQEKMKDPNDADGIKLKYGLISPLNTPMNILKNKMDEAQAKLNEAQKVGDEKKIKEYEDLLKEYEHAKKVLEGTYFNGEKHSELGLETQDAINNSTTMDTIISEVQDNKITIQQRNKQLQNLLDTQYKKLPLIQQREIGDINSLDDTKLNAIVEAHMQEGVIGNLTPEQIQARVTILGKAGFTSEQIRFLLEAGFCGRKRPGDERTLPTYRYRNSKKNISININAEHVINQHSLADNDYAQQRKTCFRDREVVKQIYNQIIPLLAEGIANAKGTSQWKNQWKTIHTSTDYNYVLISIDNPAYPQIMIQMTSDGGNQFHIHSFYAYPSDTGRGHGIDATVSKDGTFTFGDKGIKISDSYNPINIIGELYNPRISYHDLLHKKDQDLQTQLQLGEKNEQGNFSVYIIENGEKILITDNGKSIFGESQELTLSDIQKFKDYCRQQVQEHNNQYFPGKETHFWITKEQAIGNSKFMDRIRDKHVNNKLKEEDINFIRTRIQKQYRPTISLTDDQILKIINVHELDGELGNIARKELRKKNTLLMTNTPGKQDAITDENLKRFLFESGFCGSINCARYVKNILTQSEESSFSEIEDVLKIKGVTLKTPKYNEITTGYDEDNGINLENRPTIQESLFEDTTNQYGLIVIYDESKQSNHIAFIDYNGNFYDQNGANGPIRNAGEIEKLLGEYQEYLGGKAYYRVYALNQNLQNNVKEEFGSDE